VFPQNDVLIFFMGTVSLQNALRAVLELFHSAEEPELMIPFEGLNKLYLPGTV
jgi:hypothetical protein